MNSSKQKKVARQKSVRPDVLHDDHAVESPATSSQSQPSSRRLTFFTKPNKTAFWVVSGFYLFWLVFLVYVAFVNVRAGNQ